MSLGMRCRRRGRKAGRAGCWQRYRCIWTFVSPLRRRAICRLQNRASTQPKLPQGRQKRLIAGVLRMSDKSPFFPPLLRLCAGWMTPGRAGLRSERLHGVMRGWCCMTLGSKRFEVAIVFAPRGVVRAPKAMAILPPLRRGVPKNALGALGAARWAYICMNGDLRLNGANLPGRCVQRPLKAIQPKCADLAGRSGFT